MASLLPSSYAAGEEEGEQIIILINVNESALLLVAGIGFPLQWRRGMGTWMTKGADDDDDDEDGMIRFRGTWESSRAGTS